MNFDIAAFISNIILIVPGFLLAITIHEFSHGYIAYRLGDPTAKLAGRLTLNPISHMDPFGTIALILTQMIGWAKAVPVNPRYFQNPKRDMLWVSLAGPASNLIMATGIAVIFHTILFFLGGKPKGEVGSFFVEPLLTMLYYGVVINVGLGIFNLIPVPPLDGSKILASLLPRHLAYQYEQLEPYGFIILLLLVVTKVINFVIIPPIREIVNLLL